MIDAPEIALLEREWQRVALLADGSPRSKNKTAISICGPSGSGKTTVARSFGDAYSVYVEVAEDNPHLRNLLEGKEGFDAAASQRWFLKRISEFLSNADPSLPIVVDQDPAATVFTYAKMFFDQGEISAGDYHGLLLDLIRTEQQMHNWITPRLVVVFDAPPDVLRERVLRRWGPSRTPSTAWFGTIRNYFSQLPSYLPHAVRLSTNGVRVEDVVSQVKQLVKASEG